MSGFSIRIAAATIMLLVPFPSAVAQEGEQGSFACPAQAICAWSGPYFTGAMVILDSPDNECVEEPYRSFRNNASNEQDRLEVWRVQDTPCQRSNPPETVFPGEEEPDLDSSGYLIREGG